MVKLYCKQVVVLIIERLNMPETSNISSFSPKYPSSDDISIQDKTGDKINYKFNETKRTISIPIEGRKQPLTIYLTEKYVNHLKKKPEKIDNLIAGAVAYYTLFKNSKLSKDSMFRMEDTRFSLRIPNPGLLNKLKQILGLTFEFKETSFDLSRAKEDIHSGQMGLPPLSNPETYPDISKYTKEDIQRMLDRFRESLRKSTPTPEECFFVTSLIQHAQNKGFPLEDLEGIQPSLNWFNELDIFNRDTDSPKYKALKNHADKGDFGAKQWAERIENTVDWLKKKAEEGSIEANFTLGKLYLEGKSGEIKQNLEKAFSCFETAAKTGHPGAQFELGKLYLEGEGVEQDLEKAYKFLKTAADTGHPEAKTSLILYSQKLYHQASFILNQKNPPIEDLRKAQSLINRAMLIDHENQDLKKARYQATYRLGAEILASAKDLQEFKEAYRELEMSAKNDNADAIKLLPESKYCYADRILKEQEPSNGDLVLATKLLSEAAKSGNQQAKEALPDAKMRLGPHQYQQAIDLLDRKPSPSSGDITQAILQLREACRNQAITTNVLSQHYYEIATEHLLNSSDSKSLSHGITLLKIAASNGNEEAEAALPNALYEAGKKTLALELARLQNPVVDDENDEVLRYLDNGLQMLQKAADEYEHDLPSLQYQIGTAILALENPTIERLTRAVEWISEAAKNGNEDAVRELPAAKARLGLEQYKIGDEVLNQNQETPHLFELEEALKWLTLSAENGNQQAKTDLETLRNEIDQQNYAIGQQILSDEDADIHDLTRAVQLISKAANNDHQEALEALPAAQSRLGNAQYKIGDEILNQEKASLTSLRNALHYLTLAANNRNQEAIKLLPLSQYRYGAAILELKNPKIERLSEAVALISMAAAHENAEAATALPEAQVRLRSHQYQNAIHLLNKHSSPSSSDFELAVDLLYEAAQNGHPEAPSALYKAGLEIIRQARQDLLILKDHPESKEKNEERELLLRGLDSGLQIVHEASEKGDVEAQNQLEFLIKEVARYKNT